MDKLKFKIRETKNDHYSYRVVQILINGKNLIDLLKKHELFFARLEGEPDIAGKYEGLGPKEIYDNLTKHFKKAKVALLGCDCGITECWPFLAEVEEKPDFIVWKNFEQPYRKDDFIWDYRELGPFYFQKDLYKKEVQELNSDDL
jgi:hypothetical protein